MRGIWPVLVLSLGCNDLEPAPTRHPVQSPPPLAPHVPERGPRPNLVLYETEHDFGAVPSGKVASRTVKVGNGGDAPLEIEGIQVQGSTDFTLTRADTTWTTEDWPTPAIEVAQGEFAAFELNFAPLTQTPAEVRVTFHTNDPDAWWGLVFTGRGNTHIPCIQVSPKAVQFEAAASGEVATASVDIISCGASPLRVTSIGWLEGAHPSLSLELPSLPATVPAATILSFDVVYTPTGEIEFGPDGMPQFEQGTLRIESDAFDPTIDLLVTTLTLNQTCPVAVGSILEGDSVAAGTPLHLDGTSSFSPVGLGIDSWKWEAELPGGAQAVFQPYTSHASPILGTSEPGLYTIVLNVWDTEGTKSCVPWFRTVEVVPSEAIRVELTWDNEANLDLHFAHGKYSVMPDHDGDGEPDPWFDPTFDCFWFNANPNWGAFDPNEDDDPKLHADDTDGHGPEIVTLADPEVDTPYRVGVHYRTDPGVGPALASIRVFVYGALVAEHTDVELVERDMWDVLTIHWPSGEVTDSKTGDVYDIAPGYGPEL